MGNISIKKSTFFDFLNRYTDYEYDDFIAGAEEDVDYINWHGYCLVMAYGDERIEYNAVRSSCALFDASPIKKYRISGTDSGPFLDRVMTRRMSRQRSMRVIYATFCNDNGLLLDDGLLYKFAEDNYLLMISEIDHDRHFSSLSTGFADLSIEEVTPSLSGLAVQGPKSCAVLGSMGFTSVENLKPFEMQNLEFGEDQIIVARVGFTGDLGYELWFEPSLNKAVEKAISRAEETLNIRIAGYGMRALNALRLEGGFIVPGWETAQLFEEYEDERTPAELGIGWVVDLDRKEDFIGKAALLKEKQIGPRFITTGVTINQECDLEDGSPVYTVIDGEPRQIGALPSLAWSDGLQCCLSLASIQSEFAGYETEWFVETGDERITCKRIELPFVSLKRYRQNPAPV